ncbi:MAG: response regulator transcription factor [Anaerolineae bacterium]|nr:response regulator transcription factor [Anaerolineae bacterium]
MMVRNSIDTRSSIQILIVDDEPDHLHLMASLLKSRCHVSTAANAEQAIELCQQRTFDLGLLDVRLPDLPGPKLLWRLRAIDRQMGFVFVTAHADLQDVVRATLDLKAVGYISKPFHGNEFLQCIHEAIARLDTSSRLVLDDLTVCLQTRCAWQSGQLLELSKQDFDLLANLVCRPGQIVSQQDLVKALWGCEYDDAAKHMLWNAVKRLRDKLGEDRNNPRYIRTVRGIGYQIFEST